MLAFLGSAAILFAALTPASAPATPEGVHVASVTVPVAAAAAPFRRGRHQQQAVNVRPSAPSSDDEAIEEQMRMRVLMPALSGDGGG
jgi:hypothetical protein